MVIFKNHIGSNLLYSCFKSNYWNSEYISIHTHPQIMESNEEIRRYASRDRQMNRDLEATLQWMLIQIHFHLAK